MRWHYRWLVAGTMMELTSRTNAAPVGRLSVL
jgi:hypothetical protein